jgi:hypothetical protein
MPTLTPDQQQALDAHPGEPLVIVDGRTNERYILIRAEEYQRLRDALAGDIDPRESYPLADETFAEGWDDPKMADYDRYDELKP